MINLTISEAMTAADGQLVHCEDPAYIGDMFIEGITLDSRKVKPDWLFIADKGERADGHDYVESAQRSGAAAAVVEHELDIPIPQILVENSLRAMQRIAGYIREKSGVKVIGVVGSVGKTSTRQMLSCVLEQKFSVLSTEGNFNNEYGLPQTFFRLEPHHELAVVEMGISHFGEMDRLGAIARPDYVVFTNIGNMHLENLIDRSGVLRAKTEVVKHMPHNGRLFFNAADDKLCEYAKTSPIPVKFYGMDESLPVHPENIRFIDAAETDFVLNYFGTRIPVSMPAAGLHMVQNAVAAAAAAHELGLTAEQVKAGIESFSPVGHRWRVLFACCLPAANAAANNADANFEASSASAGSETFTVIDDCYNAGPDSVRAALTALVSAAKPGCRKIAMLGDMLELGENSAALHNSLGAYCAECGLDALFTAGDLASDIALGAENAGMRNVFRISKDTVSTALLHFAKPGDTVLVKASRGAHFENIVDELGNANPTKRV